ncbi:protein PRRC1 [Triticum aestivum]|uniref:protein PRRC1 n=1 Tax=Triticum aestivum TaxID=4565 RepID=UPI001D028F26|nr:protein PRRC1-like [Triticum aestivum]
MPRAAATATGVVAKPKPRKPRALPSKPPNALTQSIPGPPLRRRDIWLYPLSLPPEVKVSSSTRSRPPIPAAAGEGVFVILALPSALAAVTVVRAHRHAARAPQPPSIPAATGVAAANSSDADLSPSAALTPALHHVPSPFSGRRRSFSLPQSPFSRSISRMPVSAERHRLGHISPSAAGRWKLSLLEKGLSAAEVSVYLDLGEWVVVIVMQQRNQRWPLGGDERLEMDATTVVAKLGA